MRQRRPRRQARGEAGGAFVAEAIRGGIVGSTGGEDIERALRQFGRQWRLSAVARLPRQAEVEGAAFASLIGPLLR